MKPNNVMSIGWHEKCLRNSIKSENTARNIVRDNTARLKFLEEYNKFYTYQISEAIKAGKTGFDADCWRVKKNKESK